MAASCCLERGCRSVSCAKSGSADAASRGRAYSPVQAVCQTPPGVSKESALVHLSPCSCCLFAPFLFVQKTRGRESDRKKKNKSFSFKPRPLHRGAGTGYRAWGHPALKRCSSLREMQNTANSLQQECTFCALTQREGSMGPLGILWYPIPGVPHPWGTTSPAIRMARAAGAGMEAGNCL